MNSAGHNVCMLCGDAENGKRTFSEPPNSEYIRQADKNYENGSVDGGMIRPANIQFMGNFTPGKVRTLVSQKVINICPAVISTEQR